MFYFDSKVVENIYWEELFWANRPKISVSSLFIFNSRDLLNFEPI